MEVRTEGERFIAVSEVWHPGWSASVDGNPATILRTNIALMGLDVPAGTHQVILEFTPLHWNLGLSLSLLSAAVWSLLLGTLVWPRIGHNRKPVSVTRRDGGAAPPASP